MRNVRRAGTKPELALEYELRSHGLSFTKDVAPIATFRRRADFVFKQAKVVVLVDGCFWHSCPDHGTQPKANSAWWRSKLEANQDRDRDTDRRLRRAGWSVIRVWAHEDMILAAGRVSRRVRERTRGTRPSARPPRG